MFASCQEWGVPPSRPVQFEYDVFPSDTITRWFMRRSGGEDRFALRKAAGFSEPTHPLDLEGIEFGKHLVAPSLENGGCWHHDNPPGPKLPRDLLCDEL
jgi:hypothetical protein